MKQEFWNGVMEEIDVWCGGSSSNLIFLIKVVVMKICATQLQKRFYVKKNPKEWPDMLWKLCPHTNSLICTVVHLGASGYSSGFIIEDVLKLSESKCYIIPYFRV